MFNSRQFMFQKNELLVVAQKKSKIRVRYNRW